MKQVKGKASFALVALILVSLVSTSLASIQDNVDGDHILRSIKGEYLTLEIDTHVQTPQANQTIKIYQSTYGTIDQDKFKELFFGSGVKVTNKIEQLTPEQLRQSMIRNPEHQLLFEAMVEDSNISTRYDVYYCYLSVMFDDYDRLINWYDAVPNQTNEHSAIRDKADYYIDGLANLGWSEYRFEDVFRIPGTGKDDRNTKGNPFQIAVYRRVIDGIPVAVDDSRWNIMVTRRIMFPDEMLVMMDDKGVFRIHGSYRVYSPVREEQIMITLEDALRILEENVDYSPILSLSKDSTVNLSQIELCYRLKPLSTFGDPDYNIELETRPAWRFATKTNRNMDNEFIMFIDAITGEVMD